MQIESTVKMAVFAGEIMLSSGAETNRVEDTMSRILSNYGYVAVEIFVTPTGIFAMVEDEHHHLVTMVKRIKDRSFHLGKIALVNSLSRDIVCGNMTTAQALEHLETIHATPPYAPMVRMVACTVACASFTFLFKGNLLSILTAGFVGFVLYFFILLMRKQGLNNVLLTIFGGAIIALVTLPIMNVIGIDASYFDKIVVGSIIPLVPGIGFTNAIRDIMEGDFLSGVSRLLDALLISVSIAAGVGVMLMGWLQYFGGIRI